MSATNRNHDLIEELVAADALGGLDDDARIELERELAAHGPECAECRGLLRAYREVAGSIALSLDPTPLSAGAEERLLEAAREAPRRPATAPAEPRRWASAGPRSRLDRPGAVRRRIAAMAMAGIIALVGGVAGYVLAPRSGGLRSVALSGAGGRQLAVVYEPGATGAFVVASNLPALPAGKTYELWYQPAPGAPMRPAGTFEPGNGPVVVRANVGPAFVALAVSVEPDGGSPQPTTDPVFVAAV